MAVILGLITIGTSIISGIVGMAGGITLLSLMTFFMPMHHIIPVHGLVQLVSNGSRCFFLRANIVKKITLYFLLGAPFGVIAAFFLLSSITHQSFFYIPIILIICYTLFKPKKLPAIALPDYGFFFLGIVTGFLGPFIGATGPILAPFFLRDDLSKEEIIATKAVTQMFTHLLKIPLFIGLSFSYSEYRWVIVMMIFGAIVGTKLGVMLLGKTSEGLFRRIYKTALLLACIRLIWKLLSL